MEKPLEAVEPAHRNIYAHIFASCNNSQKYENLTSHTDTFGWSPTGNDQIVLDGQLIHPIKSTYNPTSVMDAYYIGLTECRVTYKFIYIEFSVAWNEVILIGLVGHPRYKPPKWVRGRGVVWWVGGEGKGRGISNLWSLRISAFTATNLHLSMCMYIYNIKKIKVYKKN